MAFLPVAALALGAAGAATSAYGTIESGQATSNAANYSAAVASNNATISEQNAQYAEKAGAAQGEATSRKGAAQLGHLKTAQAANNIDVNTGTAKDVQASEREVNTLNTENVVNNAELTAYGYRSQGVNFKAQSGLDTAEAEQAITGSEIGAAGGILGSASSLGFKYATLGNTGGGGGAPLSLNAADYG